MVVEIIKAIIFGIVEGITEWLPISSTGHLILVEQFLKFKEVSPEFWNMFQVVIQFGAILAVVVLYFKKIWPFTKNKEKAISSEDYKALNMAVAKSGYVDFIDVEAFTGEEIVKSMIQEAHSYGVKVIASNHDFDATPEKDETVRRLRMMQDYGADIPKMAVMPKSKQDVLTLLSATLEMSEQFADRPIITMSMAGTGVVSRLTGETFGSALTFGAASKASAPGQVGVHELKQVLDIIHSSL